VKGAKSEEEEFNHGFSLVEEREEVLTQIPQIYTDF